jgi:hypothetical protein
LDRAVGVAIGWGVAACTLVLLLALYWTQSRSPLYLFLLLVPAGTVVAIAGRFRLRSVGTPGRRPAAVALLVVGATLWGSFCWIASSPRGFVFVSSRGAPPSFFFGGYRYSAERLQSGPQMQAPAVVPGGGTVSVPEVIRSRVVGGLSCTPTADSISPAPLQVVGRIEAIVGPSLRAYSWENHAPGEIYVYLPGDRCWLAYDKQLNI